MRNHKGLYVLAILFAMGLLAAGANGNTCTPVVIARTLNDAQHDNGTGFNVSFTLGFNGGRPSTYIPLDDNLIIHEPTATSMTLIGTENAFIADFGGFGGCPTTVTWNFVMYHAYVVLEDNVWPAHFAFGWERTQNYNVGNKQNEQFNFEIPLDNVPLTVTLRPGHTYTIYDKMYAQVGFVSYSPASYQTDYYYRHMTVETY